MLSTSCSQRSSLRFRYSSPRKISQETLEYITNSFHFKTKMTDGTDRSDEWISGEDEILVSLTADTWRNFVLVYLLGSLMCSRFNFTLIKMVHRRRDEGYDDRSCYMGGCQRIVIVSAF